jgi:DNA adenine methylase
VSEDQSEYETVLRRYRSGHRAMIRRPLIRYHGGKWELADWIISHFPPHRIYCEPFSGGASVLLQKPRSYAEVYNDLDGEVVNLFRVVRDMPEQFLASIETTPFSRVEYFAAFDEVADPIEWARRTVVRSHMGFAGTAVHGKTTGFRAFSTNSGSHPASQWQRFPEVVRSIIDRLRGVVIENRDAIEVMQQQDTEQTLFYVDPPYMKETRDKGSDYRHEMSDEQHAGLLATLCDLKGMVILSGYPSSHYDRALSNWQRVERQALAEGLLGLGPKCYGSIRVASPTACAKVCCSEPTPPNEPTNRRTETTRSER